MVFLSSYPYFKQVSITRQALQTTAVIERRSHRPPQNQLNYPHLHLFHRLWPKHKKSRIKTSKILIFTKILISTHSIGLIKK